MMSFSSKRGIKCYDSTNKMPTRLANKVILTERKQDLRYVQRRFRDTEEMSLRARFVWSSSSCQTT